MILNFGLPGVLHVEMPHLKLTHKHPEIKVYAINMEKPTSLKLRISLNLLVYFL